MNVLNTFVASLENAKINTCNKTFALYNTEDQSSAYLTLDYKNELIDHYKANVSFGFNIKYHTDKAIELTSESFIHEVNVYIGHFNYNTGRYENSSVRKVGSKIPITSCFDTSQWNQFFAEKFDNSWENVCKYVYYNKSLFKYGLKNRTFRQNGEICVPTKNGKLYLLEKSTMIDMDESCTLRGFPVTWIVLNWLKNGSTENKLIRVEPPSRVLFNRVKQNHRDYANGGMEVFVLENDCLFTYKLHKSCMKRNGRIVDQTVVEAILTNPDVWSGSRWDGVKRVPLLTNKDTE
jgi:hypothetical protein